MRLVAVDTEIPFPNLKAATDSVCSAPLEQQESLRYFRLISTGGGDAIEAADSGRM